MLTIYLLRHGETEWNANGNRYCGRTDLPLTEVGLRQANLVREKLKGDSFQAVYASPLIRAKHTAEIVSGSEEVITDDRIIEADFGNWEGKTKEEFIAEDPESWKHWMDDPFATRAGRTGESGQLVVERADDFFSSLIKTPGLENQKIMVVAHNGLNRLYLSYKLGMPLGNYRKLSLDNASVTIFELDHDNLLTLKALNI